MALSTDSQIDKPQRGCPKRAELLDVNINTGAQSINTESLFNRSVLYQKQNKQTNKQTNVCRSTYLFQYSQLPLESTFLSACSLSCAILSLLVNLFLSNAKGPCFLVLQFHVLNQSKHTTPETNELFNQKPLGFVYEKMNSLQ